MPAATAAPPSTYVGSCMIYVGVVRQARPGLCQQNAQLRCSRSLLVTAHGPGKMRQVRVILLHVVACGCLGAQPPPGQAPERWMQANATRPLSRAAAATPSRRSAMIAQESLGARPVARPVARPASGNASALDPHTKLKSDHRAELVERLPRHVEKTASSQALPSWLPQASPEPCPPCLGRTGGVSNGPEGDASFKRGPPPRGHPSGPCSHPAYSTLASIPMPTPTP